MKGMKQMNHVSFSRYWHAYRMTPVAIAVGAVLILASCEKSDENVLLYMNSDDCAQSNPSLREQCNTAYKSAQKEAVKTAPKYASRADCVAEFGENQCTQVSSTTDVAHESQNSEGMWMPLMAGYMMGRMMGSGGGYVQQPLFSSHAPHSPAHGQFVDASGSSYGVATSGRSITVPKTALAPKPVTTHTITRGGFGETVTKQHTMHRSMGG
ncbi:DUF1190 family protein [Candidatus Steffania adelgidicola]|uniref:DUF1190 family protein n=1 Tax=Candidatus Steffania adelgidicola TaxID=1076626 RepID=UPI001D008014|nr:DUF1190 family protein [Candidatus Steffania adelgidicola]UDG79943.1 hypothetical protein GFK82_00490 [Candidatus Steffania adelgidicola]